MMISLHKARFFVIRQPVGQLSAVASALLLIQMNAAHADANFDQLSTLSNIASARYTIGDQLVDLETLSNAVDTNILTIPQYGMDLGQSIAITIRADETALWRNQLTNTSAYDETVAIEVSVPSSLSNFNLYIDTNKNGVIDQGDVPLLPSLLVKSGESIDLLSTASSATLQDGESADVLISATVQEDSAISAKALNQVAIVNPSIAYKTEDFNQPAGQVVAGEPIYAEIGLATCNTDPNAADRVWVEITSQKTGDKINLRAEETGPNTGRYRLSAPTELNANAIDDDIIQTLDQDSLSARATSCESSTGVRSSLGSTNLSSAIEVINQLNILTLSQQTNVSIAEVGDFVDYTIQLKNPSQIAVQNGRLKVALPQGFSYVRDSVRINNAPYTGTPVISNRYMTFDLGALPVGAVKTITYRVAVGASALSGSGTAIVFVDGVSELTGQQVASSKSRAHVEVSQGALNTDGIIVGKVYADFNRDGIQQRERDELGVAGVRLYLEGGSFVVTDREGKYSFYGVKAKTHVVKLDRTTLPRNVELIEQSNRNAGDPGSRFVDLHYVELHRADFAITSTMGNDLLNRLDHSKPLPASELIAILKARASKVASVNDALEQAIKSDLAIDPLMRSTTDAIEASGCKDFKSADGQISCDAVIFDQQADSVALKQLKVNTVAPVKELDISKALSTADNKRIEGTTADADFLNLSDNQLVPTRKIRIQIKAPKGATTQLLVNQKPVDQTLMGKEVAWEKEGISGFDYYAVPLDAGNNTLTIESKDLNGKVVSTKTIRVHAPEQVSAIETRSQIEALPADGVSEYQFVVSLKDTNGQLYAGTTPITLDTSIGTLLTTDSDVNQAGVQALVNGGELLVSLRAPSQPGKGTLSIKAGGLTKLIELQFTPQLRPMIAAGIIEGSVALRNVGLALERASEQDGFEQELRTLSGSSGDKNSTHSRAAFFLKGKIKGDYLLTLAYDSDKRGNQPLFRDIQPDDYYPVYGDSSAKGYDAQSTSPLYVRLDKGRSFAMYGDIRTRVENNEGLSLGQYDRTLTGVKGSYHQEDKLEVNAFAAQTRASQKVTETRGLGISGPYPLAGVTDTVLSNSEIIEVITRDKNNPGIVLSRRSLARFSDYEIDTLSRALYLKAPIASQDLDGNPIYLRVTVESESGLGKAGVGDEYLIGGINGRYQLSQRVSVGASYAQSNDPTKEERISSVNTVVKFNDKLKLVAEAAQYKTDQTIVDNQPASQINAGDLNADKDGLAQRIELTYKDQTKRQEAKLYYTHADQGFNSLSSPLTAGRTESGLNASMALNPKTKLRAEALQTEDQTNQGKRTGAQLSVEHQLNPHITAEVGMRYYDRDADAASTNYQAAVATQTDPLNQSLPASITQGSAYHGTTLRGKVTADLPKANQSKVFVEYEQDLNDASRNAWSVGGETRLLNKGRLYARHELSSSLVGDYGLDSQNEHQSTIVGVDANYMKDGQVFSEYRLRNSISAREAEAAIGLRNKWKVKDGLYINTSLERLESLEGQVNNTATALSLGLDYLANPNYKLTTRTEKRWGVQTDTFLNSLGYAHKLNNDVTLLTKNIFTVQQDNVNDKQRTLDRFQLGMSYRDYESNRVDHLAKLEYRYDDNELLPSAYNRRSLIASLHSNYHPVRRWTFSGHYAGKYSQYTTNDVTSDSVTHVLSGRAMYDLNERWDVGL